MLRSLCQVCSSPRVLLLALWALITVSAYLFIARVTDPVFDELNNLPDVVRYASQGLTPEAIREHINPAGPFAYAFIGVLGDLIGGELWSFRLINTLSLAALGVTLLNKTGVAALGAACAIIVSPYLPIASATILTEIPSLLVVTLGTLLWVKGLSENEAASWRGSVELVCGALLIGLAMTGRQYYIAAVPAMLITGCVQIGRRPAPSRDAILIFLLSLGVAMMPIISLGWLWDGLTSPGMRSGTSYEDFSATIGVSPIRPVTALLQIGIYALPILWLQQGIPKRYSALAIAALCGIAIGLLVPQERLWCIPGTQNVCGPLGGLHGYAYTVAPMLGRVYNMCVSFVSICGLFMLMWKIQQGGGTRRDSTLRNFSISFLGLFVVQQLFVGGNIPYYDRYTMQVAPFTGFALAAGGTFSIERGIVGALPLIILGQYRLWKFA